MLNKKIASLKKKAAITIEVTLSVALSVLALFLVFGLFSDNLATMAANAGIRNLFKSNEVAKTKPDTWNIHPAKTQVNVSQVNVQVVADQGLTLEQYISQAQSKIAYYKEHPPTTQAEIEDLAKQLTILKVCGIATDSTGASINYMYYYNTYKIKVVLDSTNLYKTYQTSINNQKFIGEIHNNQIDSVKDVINKFS